MHPYSAAPSVVSPALLARHLLPLYLLAQDLALQGFPFLTGQNTKTAFFTNFNMVVSYLDYRAT